MGGDQAEAERRQPAESDDEPRLAVVEGDERAAGRQRQKANDQGIARSLPVDEPPRQRRQNGHDDQGNRHAAGNETPRPAEFAFPDRHHQPDGRPRGKSQRQGHEAQQDHQHRLQSSVRYGARHRTDRLPLPAPAILHRCHDRISARPFCGHGDLERMSRALRNFAFYVNLMYYTYNCRDSERLHCHSPAKGRVDFAKSKNLENSGDTPMPYGPHACKTTLSPTNTRAANHRPHQAPLLRAAGRVGRGQGVDPDALAIVRPSSRNYRDRVVS